MKETITMEIMNYEIGVKYIMHDNFFGIYGKLVSHVAIKSQLKFNDFLNSPRVRSIHN